MQQKRPKRNEQKTSGGSKKKKKFLKKRYDDYDEDYDYTYREMETSFSATRLSIGPKYSLRVTDWLRPYAVAHATAMVGILGADEDSGDDDNLNEMTWRSISPGIDAGIGLDVIPVRGDQIHIATHLELGYGAALDMNFSDSNGTIAGSDENVSVGSLAIQGVQIKWGVGVHF